MLRYDCHVHGGDSIRSTCITNFEQMDQDCQGHQKGRGREEGGKARRKKERKNNGHWSRPARPESRCPKGYQPGQAIQIKKVEPQDEYNWFESLWECGNPFGFEFNNPGMRVPHRPPCKWLSRRRKKMDGRLLEASANWSDADLLGSEGG